MSIKSFDPTAFTFSDPKGMEKVPGNMGYINYPGFQSKDVHFQLRRARTPFGFSVFAGEDAQPQNPNKKSFKFELTDEATLDWMKAFDEHVLNHFIANKDKLWSFLGDAVSGLTEDYIRQTFNPCARYPKKPLSLSNEFDYTRTPSIKLGVYLNNEKRKCKFTLLRKVMYKDDSGNQKTRYEEEDADDTAVQPNSDLVVRIAPVSFYVGQKGWGVNWSAVKVGVFAQEQAVMPDFELECPVVSKKRAAEETPATEEPAKQPKTDGIPNEQDGAPPDNDDDPDDADDDDQ